MKCNIGSTDKIIRIIASIIIAAIAYFSNIWWFYILAIIVLLTAVIGFCPAYLPFKINTCKNIDTKKN